MSFIRIVFGTRTYILHTVYPHYFGSKVDFEPGTVLEYRQKYFHLYWIPFFPIGSFWAVNINGKLYDPSGELYALLPEVKRSKKHLIAWIGPLLIITGFLLYLVWIPISTISGKIKEERLAKLKVTNANIYANYFKDKKNTLPILNISNTIEYLIDSLKRNDNSAKTDTSTEALASLKHQTELLLTNPLKKYNRENTYVYSLLNPYKGNDDTITKDIKDALETGIPKFDDYTNQNDTSHIFSNLRKFRKYQYFLFFKPLFALSPKKDGKIYTSGAIIIEVTLYNIDKIQIEKQLKLLAESSPDILNHEINNPNTEYFILNGDIIHNATTLVDKYVFNEKDKLSRGINYMIRR